MEKRLAEMSNGEVGIIRGIEGGWRMHSRLQSMGVRVGKRVKKVTSQPLGGPIAFEIDNFCVALGRGMAHRITVECPPGK